MAKTTDARSPRALLLGAALRKARLQKDLTGRELSRRIQVNPALQHNWETGERIPQLEHVGMILGSLSVPEKERDRIWALARSAGTRNCAVAGAPHSRAVADAVAALDRAACAQFAWDAAAIPAVVQIPDYARATLASQQLGPGELSRHCAQLSARRERLQAAAAAGSPMQITVFIGTPALERPFRDTDMMFRQLRFLHDAQLPYLPIVVRVVECDDTTDARIGGPLTGFFMTDNDPIIHCAHPVASSFVQDDTQFCRRALRALDAEAMSADESLSYIATRAACLRSNTARRRAPHLTPRR